MNYPEGVMPEQSEPLTPEQKLEELRRQVRELTARNQILERLAGKDELTGLDNRRTFEEEIRREISGAMRTGQPVSVIMTDIDRFKDINDNMGHSIGDIALERFAAILEQGIRQTDRACRYGGEEFIMILPDTTLAHTIGVSERLRRDTETSTMVTGDKQFGITASFGISTFIPKGPYPHESPEEIKAIIDNITKQLKDSADKAMYAAKNAGRNRTGFMDGNGRIGVLEENLAGGSGMVVRHQEP